jgi:cytochrome b6-f complex iron-sulfur subunit
MDRKEFLAIVGLGATAVLYSTCLGGCGKSDTIAGPPANIDFTINLADAAYAALQKDGGYIYNSGIIVARVSVGHFVAVSQVCTHAGSTVVYQGSGSRFYCPSHGSAFATNGAVTSGPAGSPLKQYNVSLTGNSLRVYS